MACQHCSHEFTLWHLLSCIWRSSCEHRWSSAVHSKNSSWCLLQLTLRLWFCVASQAVELHAAWPDYKGVFPQRETCAGTENCTDWTTLQEVSLSFYFLYLFQKQQTSGVWHPITPHVVSPLYLFTVICSGKLWYRPFNKDLDLMVLVAPFQYIIILWFCGFGVPKMSEENGPLAIFFKWRVLEARISLCLCSASLELTGLSSRQERAASSLPALPDGAYLRAAPM